MEKKQLSEHFTLQEMCRSITAETLHIDNTPTAAAIINLTTLCTQVLEPTRKVWNQPMIINSGYRSSELNKAVGGVSNSYHRKGAAADIHVSNSAQGSALALLLLQQKLTDLVILEKHKGRYWVHVQWSYAPRHKYTTKNVP